MSGPPTGKKGELNPLFFPASSISYLSWIVRFTANLRFSAVWRPCASEGNLASDERRSQMSNPLSQKPLRPEPI
jgi:hypothetical protein